MNALINKSPEVFKQAGLGMEWLERSSVFLGSGSDSGRSSQELSGTSLIRLVVGVASPGRGKFIVVVSADGSLGSFPRLSGL